MKSNRILVGLLLMSSGHLSWAVTPGTWQATSSNNLNLGTNWYGGTVPSTTAIFDSNNEIGTLNFTPATLLGESFTVDNFYFSNSASAFSFTIPSGSLIFTGSGLTGATDTNTTITFTNTNNSTPSTNPQLWFQAAVSQPEMATFDINNSGTGVDASSSVITYSQFVASAAFSAGNGASFIVDNQGTYSGNSNNNKVANIGGTFGGHNGGQVEFDDAFNAIDSLQMMISNQGTNNGDGNLNYVGNIVNAQLYATNLLTTFNAGSNAVFNVSNTGINTGSGTPSSFIGSVASQIQFNGAFNATDGLQMTITNQGTNMGASTNNFVGYVANAQLFTPNSTIFNAGSNATINATNTRVGSGDLVGYVGGQLYFVGDFNASDNLVLTATNNGIGTVANNQIQFNGDFSVGNNLVLTATNNGTSTVGGNQIIFNGGFSIGNNATLSAINNNSGSLTNGIQFTGPNTVVGGDVLINLANSNLTVATSGTSPFTMSGLNGDAASSVTSNQNLIIGLPDSSVTSATFNGSIGGGGGMTLTKNGIGTQALNGSNTYTGVTTVNAGTLNLNGSLESEVTVNSGGTLSGTGTINNNLISNGIISPGNTVGTLTVNGLTLNSMSVYNAEVSPTASDLIQVNGAATLGGTLSVFFDPGTYTFGHIYTLINTTGGITGQFSTLKTSNIYTYTPIYNANTMQIEIGLNLSGVVTSGNPGSLARYLDANQGSIPPGSALANIIGLLGGLSTPQLVDALDKIQPSVLSQFETIQELISMGMAELLFSNLHNLHVQDQLQRQLNRETHASLSSLPSSFAQNFMNLVQKADSLTEELAMLFNKPVSTKNQQPLLSFTSTPDQLPHKMRVSFGKMNFWIQQSGGYIKQKHQHHNVGFSDRSFLTAAGLDTLVKDGFLVGVAGALGRDYIHWNKNRGKGRISNYLVSVYGSWLPCGGKGYVDMATYMNSHRNASSRKIDFPGFSAVAKQHHWSTDFSLALKGGYTVDLPYRFSAEPFVQFGYAWLNNGRTKEHGAPGLNMHIRSRSSQYATAGTGVEVAYLHACQDWMLRPALSVGYEMYNRTQGKSGLRANIAGLPASFVVTGNQSTQNLFNGKVTVTALKKSGFYVNAYYNGDVNKNLQAHEGMIQVGWKF